MIIRVSTNEVYCVLPSISYDLVASRLQSHAFANIVFCNRQVGNDFLQWSLPEGKWTPLSEVRGDVSSQVRQAYDTYTKIVRAAFGSKTTLAQAVLTTPSEDYVFYRINSGGVVELAFASWGYKFPQKTDNGVICGPWKPATEMQDVKLRFIYDGEPIGDMPFTINGQPRITSNDGMFDAGSHPVGVSYPISVEDKDDMTLIVEKGRALYDYDLTKYVLIEVVTRMGDVAASGVSGTVNFNGRTITIATDNKGQAQVELPFRGEVPQCAVIVNGVKECKKPTLPKTVFRFELPFPQVFLCVDCESRKPIAGVKNVVTITYRDHTKESVTLMSDSKGLFTLSAKNDSIIDIVSTKMPVYEPKKTGEKSFKAINKTIMMKPEQGKLHFRTLDAKNGVLIPDCDLKVSGSISGVLSPSNSGNGEFTIIFRKNEKLTVIASKKWYKTLSGIKEKTWVDLQKNQEWRDIKLERNPVLYENTEHPKYKKKTYFLPGPNCRFRFEWRTCSVCTMLTVTDANGKIIKRFGIDSPGGDGNGKKYTPDRGSIDLECPTETVCVIIQSVNQDTAWFKIFCD